MIFTEIGIQRCQTFEAIVLEKKPKKEKKLALLKNGLKITKGALAQRDKKKKFLLLCFKKTKQNKQVK